MQLHSFFNSSTSYRVRIALALKGLSYDTLPVNIRTGEHRDAGYVARVNPSASVPALVDGDFRLGQSLAIIDYLDQLHPAAAVGVDRSVDRLDERALAHPPSAPEQHVVGGKARREAVGVFMQDGLDVVDAADQREIDPVDAPDRRQRPALGVPDEAVGGTPVDRGRGRGGRSLHGIGQPFQFAEDGGQQFVAHGRLSALSNSVEAG